MSNQKMLATKKPIFPAFKQNKGEIHNSISVKEISVMLRLVRQGSTAKTLAKGSPLAKCYLNILVDKDRRGR